MVRLCMLQGVALAPDADDVSVRYTLNRYYSASMHGAQAYANLKGTRPYASVHGGSKFYEEGELRNAKSLDTLRSVASLGSSLKDYIDASLARDTSKHGGQHFMPSRFKTEAGSSERPIIMYDETVHGGSDVETPSRTDSAKGSDEGSQRRRSSAPPRKVNLVRPLSEESVASSFSSKAQEPF